MAGRFRSVVLTPILLGLSISLAWIVLYTDFGIENMRKTSSLLFSAAATVVGSTAAAPSGNANNYNSSIVDLSWHPPRQTWVNSLERVINDNGTNGFYFGGSELPEGTKYGTYNWCNMPHIRPQEYPKVPADYTLEYVEVIHRHHKRTPYASNTFPKESYPWTCSNQALFYYGQPINPLGNASASTHWSVFTSLTNPFEAQGFQGDCQFPQITRSGLDDSWQHGKDLYGVYHDLLGFIPSDLDHEKVEFRVTNNVITSQVAGMLVAGMYPSTAGSNTPLKLQPQKVDSLEPQYSCPAASSLSSSYGVGSKNANWTDHLKAAKSLYKTLDSVSAIPADDTEWHKSFDHYYDNLSARQCHDKPLPCNIENEANCVSQRDADSVYRLGQWEYSYLYRDAPQSLTASVGSYGVWLAELAQNIRDARDNKSGVIYRHNVAHDGSVSRLLSILQVDEMVWVGMGAEVAFEIYSKKGGQKKYIRILWGGKVLKSSNPSLGSVDLLDADVFLAYLDGLVGRKAEKVVTFCES